MANNKTTNVGLNKSPENNYDYLNHKYKELLNENWDKLDSILAGREVNIHQFNALGEGKNYTSEIQNAINSLPDEGGVVYVPQGLYLINTWANGSQNEYPLGGLSLKSNMILLLSPGAIFKAISNDHTNYSIIRVTGKENVAIIGGTFIGDTEERTIEANSGFGISVVGSKNVVIKDVLVKNCAGDGIYVGANRELNTESQNVKIINATSTLNSRCGLYVRGCKNILIEKSNFTFSKNGLSLEPISSTRLVEDITIDNCFVMDNVDYGIIMRNQVRNGSIKNTTIRNNGTGLMIELSNENKLSDNTIESNRTNGVYIKNSNLNITESNTCSKNGNDGIVLEGSNNNLLATNMIFENGKDTHNTFSNILLKNSSSHNSLQNNMIRKGSGNKKSKYGINVLTDNCEANFIINNDLYDSGVTSEVNNLSSSTIDISNKKTNIDYNINPKTIIVTDTNGLMAATNIDDAMDEIFNKLKSHVEQLVDVHTASSIKLIDSENNTEKTNVEDAIQELYDEIKKARTYAP